MVVVLESDILVSDMIYSSFNGRTAKEELSDLALQADVELALDFLRLGHDAGFTDCLFLAASDAAEKEPFRRNALQQTHLKHCRFNPGIGQIDYFPVGQADFRYRFFKTESGRIYAANLEQVVECGKNMLENIGSLSERPFVLDVSVDKLDYFFNTSDQGLPVAEFTPFYNTCYRTSKGFARWLEEMRILLN